MIPLIREDRTSGLPDMIGTIEPSESGLRVKLRPYCGLSKAQIFEIFGNCGIELLKVEIPEGISDPKAIEIGSRIYDFRILEWSFPK
jgi:hypothetical protein